MCLIFLQIHWKKRNTFKLPGDSSNTTFEKVSTQILRGHLSNQPVRQRVDVFFLLHLSLQNGHPKSGRIAMREVFIFSDVFQRPYTYDQSLEVSHQRNNEQIFRLPKSRTINYKPLKTLVCCLVDPKHIAVCLNGATTLESQGQESPGHSRFGWVSWLLSLIQEWPIKDDLGRCDTLVNADCNYCSIFFKWRFHGGNSFLIRSNK